MKAFIHIHCWLCCVLQGNRNDWRDPSKRKAPTPQNLS